MQHRGKMIGRKVRFAHQHDHGSFRMPAADLAELVRGMAIARADASHVAARNAVQAIDQCSGSTGAAQQFGVGRPVVTPIKIEANALAQFVARDFAGLPFVQDVLVAGKHHLQAQQQRAATILGEPFQQRGTVELRGRQRMVIAHQQNVGRAQQRIKRTGGEHAFIAAEGLGKVTQVFAAAARIGGADLALDGGQRVPLAGAAPQPDCRLCCHGSCRLLLV